MDWSRHYIRRCHDGQCDVSIETRLEIETPVYEYEQRKTGKAILRAHGKGFAFQDIKLFVDDGRVELTLSDSAVTLKCHDLDDNFYG